MHFLTLRKLKSPDWDVRCEAIRDLARSGHKDRVQLILDAVKDEAYGVRAAAAEALGSVRDPRATRVLRDLLEDSNDSVKAIAAKSLDAIGWKKEHFAPAKELPAEIFMECQCGVGFSVSSVYAGRTGKCSNCGASVVVPFPETLSDKKAA
jgi:hypothetical protein